MKVLLKTGGGGTKFSLPYINARNYLAKVTFSYLQDLPYLT